MKSPQSSADISYSFLITNSELIAVGQRGLGSVICKCQWAVAFLRAVIIPLSSVRFFPSTFSISQLLCPSPGGFTVHCVTPLSKLIYGGVCKRVQVYPLWTCSGACTVLSWCVCAREIFHLTYLQSCAILCHQMTSQWQLFVNVLGFDTFLVNW